MDELMHESKVDQVRLRAATELLDRAGLKPGQELTITGDITHTHNDPAQAVRERLKVLAERMTPPPAELEAPPEDATEDNCAILDAEIVEEETTEQVN